MEIPIGPETDAPSEDSAGALEPEGAEEAADFKDRWLRAEAELHNYRRRARREMDEVRRAAEDRVLIDAIRWLDDLERALEAARSAGAEGTWADGIALVLQKGRETLKRHGVDLVDPQGQPFDPMFHEAVLEVDPTAAVPPGHVTNVVLKGYRRGERALRAAQVVVARSHPDER